jgi:hypothetical protein
LIGIPGFGDSGGSSGIAPPPITPAVWRDYDIAGAIAGASQG